MSFDNITSERIAESIKGVKSIIEWANDKIYYNHWFIFVIWIVIITGVITFFFKFKPLNKKFEKDIYYIKNKLSDLLINSIIIIILGKVFNIINPLGISSILKNILYKYVPIILVLTLISYIVCKLCYRKAINIEETFIKSMIYINYIFLFGSVSFGIFNPEGIGLISMSTIGFTTLVFTEWIVYTVKYKEINGKYETIELYESRKNQLEDFNKKIRKKSNNNFNFAIALSGEWGSGKSTFLNAYKNKYKENQYIYIQPMITDTFESLIKQFSVKLCSLMDEQEIIIGKNNSIENYFNEILKIFNFNTKISLDSFINLKNTSKGDENLKNNIQKDIDKLLIINKNKLIVIIDDFDRIDEEKQYIILHFIKEIIDFKGIVTIFAFDYEKIKRNKNIDNEYLEKFVKENYNLAKLSFKQLLDFHVKYILEGCTFEHEICNKILNNFLNDPYIYYEKIQENIYRYINKEQEKSYKEKDQGKIRKYDTNIYKIIKYNNYKDKFTYNSRRVQYFLEKLKSKLSIIDSVYLKQNNDEKDLKFINLEYIIYIFCFLEIFDKELFDEIKIKESVAEYKLYLDREIKMIDELVPSNTIEMKLTYLNKEKTEVRGDVKSNDLNTSELEIKLIYINLIFKEILTEREIVIFDENKEKENEEKIKFEKELIKQIFFDSNYENNTIDLITDSQKIITNLDNNELIITDFEDAIKVQKAIFSIKSPIDKTIERIKRLVGYSLELCRSGKISFSQFVKLSLIQNNARNIEYLKYYFDPFIDNINKNVFKITEQEKRISNSDLRNVEIGNIMHYRIVFEEYLYILSINDIDFDENKIKDVFKNVTYTKDLVDSIKDYLRIKSYITDETSVDNIEDLVNILKNKINKEDYSLIEFEILEKKINDFLYNDKLINVVINIQATIVASDKYKDLLTYWNINDFKELKQLLEMLDKENELNEDMVSLFQKAVCDINNNFYCDIDIDIKNYCSQILKKISIDICWNEYSYIHIEINVERILKKQIEKDKEIH